LGRCLTIIRAKELLDSDFSATNGLTGEEADFAVTELDHTVTGGVNGEVTAQLGAITGALSQADLADDNLADFDFFATKQLDAEALTRTVVDIFGGTASFYV
jgi:hypothetical protein